MKIDQNVMSGLFVLICFVCGIGFAISEFAQGVFMTSSGFFLTGFIIIIIWTGVKVARVRKQTSEIIDAILALKDIKERKD